MKDLERATKWTRRGDDWTRLSDAAREDYVAETCGKLAGWSYDMARFFGGVN